MALQGYVIGISEDTSVSPTSFWAGVGAAQVDNIDSAEFLTVISAARVAAGTLQVQIPESHVEVFAVTKTVDYTTPVGSDGI